MTVRISGTNTTAAPGFQGGDTDTGIRPGTNEIEFVTGGSVAATFNSSGNLAFPDGQGIDFSATGDSSGTMSSELLDDYEEGTWTAVMELLTSPTGALTYSSNTMLYTKVGRLVHIQGNLGWSANNLSGGSGSIVIRGLPYTASAQNSERGGVSIVYSSTPFTGITVYSWALRTETNLDVLTINYANTTDGSLDNGVQRTEIAGSGAMFISGCYVTP